MKKRKPSEELSNLLFALLNEEQDNMLSELILRSTEKILQEALEGEASDFLGRDWYERNEEFRGWRNGYQRKQCKCAEGRLNLRKPRIRGNSEKFESKIMKKLDSIDDKLRKIALEGYVRGLSTRDIEEVFTDENDDPLLSRSSMSNVTEKLYKEYEEFASRDLSGYDIIYLFIDGVYEAVRKYTRNQAILCCWGICSDGTKVMLHLQAATGESENSWDEFFEDMLSRGLRQPLLVVSDGAAALKKSITKKFPIAKRQRCISHKLRNISNKLPKDSQKEVLDKAREVYYAGDKETADVKAEKFIRRYSDKYPSAVKCFNDDLGACLTHLDFPEGHRKYIRTTNLIERSFVEEKRRTKIIPEHAHEKGAIGLVYSVLIRSALKWRRVKMTELELTQLKHLKELICPEKKNEEKISYELVA